MSAKKIIGIFLVVATTLGVLMVLPGLFFVGGLGDLEPPPYDADSFNQLSNDILQQSQITAMDDFSRYVKKINGVYVTLEKPERPHAVEPIAFLDYALDSLKIDRPVVENLRRQLAKTRLREFMRSNDSILFRTDGYMGHSWGYFYSAKPMKPGADSFSFAGTWVRVYQDVDTHWKKANIGF